MKHENIASYGEHVPLTFWLPMCVFVYNVTMRLHEALAIVFIPLTTEVHLQQSVDRCYSLNARRPLHKHHEALIFLK